jgi:hypothetical protein
MTPLFVLVGIVCLFLALSLYLFVGGISLLTMALVALVVREVWTAYQKTRLSVGGDACVNRRKKSRLRRFSQLPVLSTSLGNSCR